MLHLNPPAALMLLTMTLAATDASAYQPRHYACESANVTFSSHSGTLEIPDENIVRTNQPWSRYELTLARGSSVQPRASDIYVSVTVTAEAGPRKDYIPIRLDSHTGKKLYGALTLTLEDDATGDIRYTSTKTVKSSVGNDVTANVYLGTADRNGATFRLYYEVPFQSPRPVCSDMSLIGP